MNRPSKKKKATNPREEAISESYRNKWNGINLNPYTPLRASIAAEMGMTWPLIPESDGQTRNIEIEEKGKKRKVKFFFYKQGYKDSIVAIWLCLQPDSRLDEIESDITAAKTECWQWATDEGILPGTEKSGLAYGLLQQIIGQMLTTKGNPKPKEDEEQESGEV